MGPRVVHCKLHVMAHAMIQLDRQGLIVAVNAAEDVSCSAEVIVGPLDGGTLRRKQFSGVRRTRERTAVYHFVSNKFGRREDIGIDKARQFPAKAAEIADGKRAAPTQIAFYAHIDLVDLRVLEVPVKEHHCRRSSWTASERRRNYRRECRSARVCGFERES